MFQQLKTAVSGAQILFVAFGALVLVPLLTGLNPAMALLGAGVGTLLFQLCTGRKVPIFLGSSFAFIAPIIYSTQTWGLPSTLFGLFAAGFMYFVFAALVRWRGIEAVHRLLPPVVIGPVIMIIGLSVATVASNMAMGRAGGNQVMDYQQSLLLAAVSLSATVLVAVFARGMFRLVPILAGVVVGYVLAAMMGLVDFSKIANAPWFAMPQFVSPEVNWAAALFMLPVAIAPAIEHIGGVMAISGVTGHDYTKTRPAPHPGRRWPGRVLCRADWRPAGHHLRRSDRRSDDYPQLQSGGDDLGRAVCHRHGIFWQVQRPAAIHSDAGDGWHHGAAVWHHRQHWPENPD